MASNHIIEHPPTFRLSGSSDLPAYPGFIVMYTEHAGLRSISVSSKMKRLTLAWMDSWMVRICSVQSEWHTSKRVLE
jgi:hypothetical protein